VSKDELTAQKINSAGGGLCKACKTAESKKYREEKPDAKRESQRRYYENNRDKIREKDNRYRENNRDKVREWGRVKEAKRRAQKRSATTTDAAELAMIQQFYAECPAGYHVDHVIPIALGGRHELANLQWLEASLNASKGAKQPGEWEDPRPITCSP
jgi:5-methylcytosine-specific restriction endonuclease McrA